MADLAIMMEVLSSVFDSLCVIGNWICPIFTSDCCLFRFRGQPWEQRAIAGDPKFECSQNLPNFPYARYAESLGVKGILVDTPSAIGSAWDEALLADRPVVIDAVTDPDVPPLLPHISFEQAKAYASALFQGDPNARGVVRQTFRGMVDAILPPRTNSSFLGDEEDYHGPPELSNLHHGLSNCAQLSSGSQRV